MKTCSTCKKEKYFIYFHKSNITKDGYQRKCKDCTKKYQQQYNQENKEKTKQYQQENKQKISENKKQYYQENKEKIKQYQQQYQQENKEKINEYYNEYNKKRRQTDTLFKLRGDIRSLIYVSMKNKGYTKTSKTFEILGCTFEDFKLHIERQFKKGMSWGNSGKWHYDHIYPVSLAESEEEIIRLNHYTNFQPLWAEENLKKGNKIEET